MNKEKLLELQIIILKKLRETSPRKAKRYEKKLRALNPDLGEL